MENGVLFIRLRLLGDIIFTIPSLIIFKKRFPDSRVHYVVEEPFRQIGGLLPGVDELIVVPRKMGMAALYRFGRSVRRKGIGMVIDFHSGPKSALMTVSTRIPQRIGYRTPNRNLAYTHLVPRWLGDAPAHSVENQARLLEAVGIHVSEIPPYPRFEIAEESISPEVLEFTRSSSPRVIVHTGAGNRFRDWGENRFSGLVRKLRSGGVRVGMVGNGSEERHRAALLSKELDMADFTGKLSIPELVYLIGRSSAYVGVDSGPLHVASLTRTPLVALYGPNLPEISGPWRKESVAILQQRLDCRPCSQRRCLYDTMRCLVEITVDEVYEAVTRFLIRS